LRSPSPTWRALSGCACTERALWEHPRLTLRHPRPQIRGKRPERAVHLLVFAVAVLRCDAILLLAPVRA
jgi:hypothetical protein